MKNVVFALLQFILFFALFGLGSLILPVIRISFITTFANGTRAFQWAGLLLALIIAVLIFVVEAMRGRISKAGPWTSGVFVLAVLLGLLKFQFGLISLGQ